MSKEPSDKVAVEEPDTPAAGASPSADAEREAESLIGGLGLAPAAKADVGRILAETLARAMDAEEALEAERRRAEWLRAHTTVDEVTGLLNRRGFEEGLQRSLARARRYDEVGTLMLVDVVSHQAVREEAGPSAGDYLLTAVGNIVRGRFREVDYVARLERGRFALLLPIISPEDARRRAAMLKSQLDRVIVPWQNQDLAVEARIGLVHYGQRDAAEDLLERVEAELEEREQRVSRLRHPAE